MHTTNISRGDRPLKNWILNYRELRALSVSLTLWKRLLYLWRWPVISNPGGYIKRTSTGRHQVHNEVCFRGERVWGIDSYVWILFLWAYMVCVLISDVFMLWKCKDLNFKIQSPEPSPSLRSLFRHKGWKSILTTCHFMFWKSYLQPTRQD